MKLEYKKNEKQINQSFSAVRQLSPHLESNWHFHEEYELIFIRKGTGIRIVGDNLENFRPLKLVLCGPWLPHVWKNDDTFGEEGSVDVVIIKFNQLINGLDLFSLPEFVKVSEMLKKSTRGISFPKKVIHQVEEKINSLTETSGARNMINFMDILDTLSNCKEYRILATPEFTLPLTIYGENRLNRLINYITENYHTMIDLDKLAEEAAMTRSSVCRFFKNRTNKTIFQFLNEFRIGKACQLLINGNHSISEVCFITGFNSITSFNRVFRQYKNVTPSEFKKKYKRLSN